MKELPVQEKEFQAEIVKIAKANGWLVYHTHDSRHSPKGFPDLLMVKDGYMLVWELKSPKGKCTDEQIEWLEAFDSVRKHNIAVKRPKDMDSVVRALTGQANWGTKEE